MKDAVKISPITILVGKNSVGKSTFARIFPLLRQSVNRRKRGPFVWFDERLVDFGGVDKTISWGEDSLEIEYEMSGVLANYATKKYKFIINGTNSSYGYSNPIMMDDLRVIAEIKSLSSVAYVSCLTIEFDGVSLKIEIDNKKTDLVCAVHLDGVNIRIPAGCVINVDQGHVIPQINFSSKESNSSGGSTDANQNPWVSRLIGATKNIFHGNTSHENIKKYASVFPICKKERLSEYRSDCRGNEYVEKIIDNIASNDVGRRQILKNAILANISQIMEAVNLALTDISMSVRYIRPLRASAERYYRRADLAVDEIEPDGSNLPVFLDSLSDDDLRSFVDWMSDSIGLEVEVSRVDAQLEIKARTSSDKPLANVADMGFGISQVLPIAAQLWLISKSKRKFRRAGSLMSGAGFVVMEQPELHLHPAMQASLANLFGKLVEKNASKVGSWVMNSLAGGGLRMIIETHSQHIINRLGQLIDEGVIKKDDVSIIMFEEDNKRKNFTKIKKIYFDDEGVLNNWPFGFFEP